VISRAAAPGRRVAAWAALVCVAVAAGAGGVAWSAPADEKADVDKRLESARDRLQSARDRESVLTDQVQGYTDRIRVLEDKLTPLRARSERLAAELDTLRERLDSLTGRLAEERARLARAEASLARRQLLLGRRLRELYVRGAPDPILVLMQSGSLTAAVETADVLEGIASRDGDLARSVSQYADETRRTRDRIADVRADVARSEARAADAAQEALAAKADLERQRSAQGSLLAERRSLLGSVRGDREDIEAEAEGLEERSADLANTIRAAQGLPAAPSGSIDTGAPSSAGLVWPVSGPITSGFGPRWGRMHEGIDIAGASGTPIAAAKGGTVIVAGWSGGYGNLVVIDHGGGISTAYGHNSSLSVSVGQTVSQGQVIAGMGTTGHSTGVHCHFEVRVNGAAVDPLGYL